jgi:hypothetical protein
VVSEVEIFDDPKKLDFIANAIYPRLVKARVRLGQEA